tara:strand:- start:354 stop:626 length:273 start_codon:yes stop_codon:yes gene_type:complete
MAKILQFPNLMPSEKRKEQLEARMSEIEHENTWIKGDIEHLNQVLVGNLDEYKSILRELAKLHKLEPEIEFESEFDFDFDFEFNPNLEDD